MPESKRNHRSRADLHVVPIRHDQVATCIDDLLRELCDIHILNAELRQLWLETHWIKSDHEQGVLSVPTNWELQIFQIERGHIGQSIKEHPEVIDRATSLAHAIRAAITDATKPRGQ